MKVSSQAKRFLLVSIPIFSISFCAHAVANATALAHDHKPSAGLTYTAEDALTNLNFAASQYSKMIKNVNNKKGLLIDKQCADEPLCIPRSQDDGKIHMVHPNKWVVGFYPGALWMLLNQAENLPVLKDKNTHDAMMTHARQYSELLFEQANRTDTHDLGFMVDAPLAYAIQNKHVSDEKKAAYQAAIKTAEANLLARYAPDKPVMRSWDFIPRMRGEWLDENGNVKRKNMDLRAPWGYPVIVDNMMNMEILMKSSDKQARAQGFSHASATMQYHYFYEETDTNKERPIAYHLFDYGDMKPGNWQGLGNLSAWTRGQGWGLYGFVVSTIKAKKYPEYSKQAAEYEMMVDKIFNTIEHHTQAHPVPIWDFFASRTDADDIAAYVGEETAQYSRILDLCLDMLPEHILPYQGFGPIQYTETILSTQSISFLSDKVSPDNVPIIDDNKVQPCGTNPYYLNERFIPRDTSAGALYASALYKMAAHIKGTEKAKKYEAFADRIMVALTKEYRTDVKKEVSYDLGFVLNSATGHLPEGSEVDTPIVYGDYYFIEANLNKLALRK
jgi:hypothetical protein